MSFEWEKLIVPTKIENDIIWQDVLRAEQYNQYFLSVNKKLDLIDVTVDHFDEWINKWHDLQIGLLKSEIQVLENWMDRFDQIENEQNNQIYTFDFLNSRNDWSTKKTLTATKEQLSLAKSEEGIAQAGQLSIAFMNAKKHVAISGFDSLFDDSELTFWEHQLFRKPYGEGESIQRPSWYRGSFSQEDAYLVLEYRFDTIMKPCTLFVEPIDGIKMDILMIESVNENNQSVVANQKSKIGFDLTASFRLVRMYFRQRYSQKKQDVHVFRFGLKKISLDTKTFESFGSWISRPFEIQEPNLGIAIEATDEKSEAMCGSIQYAIGCVDRDEILSWIPIQPQNQRYALETLEHPIERKNDVSYVWFSLRMKPNENSIRLYRTKDLVESQFYVYEDGYIGYLKTMYHPSIQLHCEYEPLDEEKIWVPSIEAQWFVRPSGERGETFLQLSSQYAVTLSEMPWIPLKNISRYEDEMDSFFSESPENLLVLVNGVRYENITDYTIHPSDRETVVKVPDSYIHIDRQLYFPVVLFQEKVEIEVHYQVMKLPIVILVECMKFHHANAYDQMTIHALKLLKVEGV